MISKKFLKTSFLYTITGALPLASQLVLLPFYTNNLSTAQLGYLSFYIGFSQLIQIIVGYSFDAVIQSNYFEYKNDFKKLKSYLSSVVIMVLLIGIAVTTVLSVFGPLLFDVVYSSEAMTFYPYGLISVATGVFTAVFKIITNLYIAQQRAERFAFSNVLNFILILFLSITGLHLFPETLIGPMYGRLFAGLVSFVIIIGSTFKAYGFSFNFNELKKTLNFNLSLFIVALVSWFITYIDRYIIQYSLLDSDVGIYDLAVKTTLAIEVVMGALLNTVIAPIYNIWSNNRSEKSTPEVNRYYNVITSMAIILIGLTIVGLPIVIPYLVKNKDYYEAFEYMPILCLSYITMVVWHMYSLPLMFEKRGFVFTKILIGSAVFKLLSGLILINLFGLYGAVWSVLLTKLFHHGWLAIDSQKIFHLKYNKIKILMLPALYSLVVIISNQVLPNQYELYYHIAGLVIFGIIIFLVFKNEIIIVLKKYGLKF